VSALDRLATAAGQWHGTYRLEDPHLNAMSESPTTATVARMLGGLFLRVDYTWAYHGKPQEGSLLIGHDPKSNVVSVHWIDTWHMSHKVMACHGAGDGSGTVAVLGSYEAPPGPDWGWRTAITGDGETLRITMHNVWPEGREELAVDATYDRSA
jgi:hypothetical protein